MPELFEGIVATRTVCAEGSLDLVSEKTRPRRQDQGCPRVTGYVWILFLQTARASRQDTALMLKTRAQYVPWSPRQPLQTLNSTRAQASKGGLCTSTLTEPVKLATYFKNGNEVAAGPAQARARRWACPQSRSPHVNGADFGADGPAGPSNNRSLETTTARARHGHGDNNFCVVGCRTTPWYGATGMPSTLLCTNARTPGGDLVSPKSCI